LGERLRSRLFTRAVALEVVGKNMKSAISARGGNADARRGRGRPPKFDRDVALSEAMKLFWEHGFEGTSTDDLEAALKMGPSSILNSFGSKEQLYALAIETYMGDPTKYFVDMLNSSPDTRQAFENLVNAAADEFTRSDHPTGCMISLAGTHMSAAYESIRALLAAQRALSEKLLADRLRRGVSQGDLPADTNVEVLASYFGTIFRGMAVQARDGRSRAQLQAIGRLAMRAWPDAKHALPKLPKSNRPPCVGRRRARRPASE
jgi:AcrR family transcriptional regulator